MFQDESTVRLQPLVVKTYARKGKPYALKCDSMNKAYVGISGLISSEGKFYFEVREQEGFKQKGLVLFLEKARKAMRKNLLIIWDNAPSHKSKTVKNYLAMQNRKNPKIWLANIPPYSPELNPIELLWGYLKNKLANQFFKTTKQLKQAVINELTLIKKNKKLIQSFFRHRALRCYQFFY